MGVSSASISFTWMSHSFVGNVGAVLLVFPLAFSVCSFACLPVSVFQSLFRLFLEPAHPVCFVQSHTEEMMFEIVHE